jgi:alkylation response protein AidB-like acyl-CoA dehydrogenase
MTTKAPTRAELVGRATDLVDVIRKHAEWQDENRVLHDDVLQGLRDAGLLRLRVPKRYGGYEADTRTAVDVIAELSRADGSVGWTVSALIVGSWLAGLLPDSEQDEVFADPDVFIGDSVSPKGVAVPTDGGVILNGKWPFCSGVLHSTWFAHSAVQAVGENEFVPVVVVVPVSDLTIVDDWNTAGLRATGSVTTIAKDLFVPESRVVPLIPLVMNNEHRSKLNADSPVWKAPFSPISAAGAGAVPLGIARAAQEQFFERLPNRGIAYTNYENQSDAPVTHFQVAEAAGKIDEAQFHVHRAADRVDTKVRTGEEWTLTERALARMEMGASTQRSREAVDALDTGSGGSSIYSHVPMQRIVRDMHAVSLHGLLHPNTNLELYGRVLCGLEPNTQLI